MKLQLRELACTVEPDQSIKKLHAVVCRTLRIRPESLQNLTILRRSIDARPVRKQPVFIYTLGLDLDDDAARIAQANAPHTLSAWDDARYQPATTCPVFDERPVVIGAGPAGLWAALLLAHAGARPLIIERGEPVGKRQKTVGTFWAGKGLNPESNVLFGEGGAGMFSDGKLTSRSKDRVRQQYVLDTLVECGARADTAYDAAAHLGSDTQPGLLLALRQRIEAMGGAFRFQTRVQDLRIESGQLRGLCLRNTAENQPETEEWINTRHAVLAAGASARDLYQLLYDRGVPLLAKEFAVGVRVEIAQSAVNRAQWGQWAEILEPASFRLTRRPVDEADSCYSFCMCPGGTVMACASSASMLTTNGMSLSTRPGQWANAAFLVPVSTTLWKDQQKDAKGAPLGGIRLQEQIEQAAFIAGGSDYRIPVTTLDGFLHNRAELPKGRNTARVKAADLSGIFPQPILTTLQKQIRPMLQSLRGLNPLTAAIYAAETRTSSPIRILRDDSGQSTGVRGLFPAGEGAGYAGGIVSSAIDGMLAAEAILTES